MQKTKTRGNYKSRLTSDQIFTIPNLLSFGRILLIPLIVWLYVFEGDHFSALWVILLSTATDVLDGYVARRFDMVTDFGKMIDPVADKLTQITILICLSFRFKLMSVLLLIMLIKELVSLSLRLRLFYELDRVYSAAWHGKANTVTLYAVICVHVIFYSVINPSLSVALILFSSGFMIYSFVSYTIFCAREMLGRG